jgi:peptidoglycan/xylan/chitin deacetylase (PgdA/CDA1 family)
MNKQTLKTAFLTTCKFAGIFKLSRYATRNRLRILCYHGIARSDEHLWRPALYVTPKHFAERMDLLLDQQYPVLSLDAAVKRHAEGTLPNGATVITFDDGFKDFYDYAWPIVAERNLPTTLYVTTYHSVKQTPIFRLVLSYLFWRTKAVELDLRSSDLLPSGLRQHFIMTEPNLEKRIIRHAEINLSDTERTNLLSDIAGALGVDYSKDLPARLFEVVSSKEMTEMADDGIDIQLHTHRHCLPTFRDGAIREISENRDILKLINGNADHFCYPSGLWSETHLPMLRELGVESATTCDEGLNKPGSDPLTLKRFLDGSQVSELRFEAEMSGFMDLLRDGVAFLRRLRSKPFGDDTLPNPIHAAE